MEGVKCEGVNSLGCQILCFLTLASSTKNCFTCCCDHTICALQVVCSCAINETMKKLPNPFDPICPNPFVQTAWSTLFTPLPFKFFCDTSFSKELINDVTFKGQVQGWYNCWLFKRLHCCEWCVVLFSIFFSSNLWNYIFQSAKKCEMTSFSMTTLHVDLNEAAKCVDIILTSYHQHC